MGLDPKEFILAQFVMGEKDLVPYLYADLKKPLRMNTDDWSTIEFSTPKQLVLGNNVSRFVDPKKRHLNAAALMKVISSESKVAFEVFLNTIIRRWDTELINKIDKTES